MCLEILKVESLEDMENNIHHFKELILDLVLSAIEVRIILRKPANPGQAVQLAALLIPIYRSELCKAQRKIAIAAGRSLINLAMMRAVHRLEHIFFALLRSMDRLEGVFPIFGPVA